MSIQKNTNRSSEKHVAQSTSLIGLDYLKRTFERDFFAQTSVEVSHRTSESASLVIHLSCNFGLTESLFHLNNGNWGNFQNSISGDVRVSPIHTALLEVAQENNLTVNIQELSIHLKDTSIIITKLPHLAIQDHLESILVAVSSNFVHFTKGLTKMPYEIFVPIYEETENSFSLSQKKSNKEPNYLEFWGLYFENEDEASVFDVASKNIIEESSFFLLNQWD